MSRTQFVKADRISTSILATAETRCLRWMAARLPRQVTSDQLTMLAFVAMLMTGLSYLLARTHPLALLAADAWLVVNWFGDSLDGTLARVRGHERPRYGFYVDHIVDAFGIVLLVGGLGLSGYMSPAIAMLVLIAYLLLSIEIYLATYCLGRFRLSYWKLGPTELRLLLCIGNTVLLFHPQTAIFGRQFLLFDVGGAVAAIVLVTTTVVSAIQSTRMLYRAEPLPDTHPRQTACRALSPGS